MKKNLAIIAFFATTLGAMAQDQDFKPLANSNTAEVNFTPFSGSPIQVSYLRYRRFIADKQALRLGLFVDHESDNPEEDVKRSSTEFGIRLGTEFHGEGTERLSPFVGVELDVLLKSSSYKDNADGAILEEIKGAWDPAGFQERAFWRAGVNLIFGADYYVAKRLYLGTEFGIGFQYQKTNDVKFTLSGGTADDVKGSGSSQFGVIYNGALRLGFIF